jgi:hypothetical protein
MDELRHVLASMDDLGDLAGRPEHGDGFEERYWSPVNSPSDSGRRMSYFWTAIASETSSLITCSMHGSAKVVDYSGGRVVWVVGENVKNAPAKHVFLFGHRGAQR